MPNVQELMTLLEKHGMAGFFLVLYALTTFCFIFFLIVNGRRWEKIVTQYATIMADNNAAMTAIHKQLEAGQKVIESMEQTQAQYIRVMRIKEEVARQVHEELKWRTKNGGGNPDRKDN